MHIHRKYFLMVTVRRAKAAVKIQRFWKQYLKYQRFPKVLQMLKNNSATLVQKFMRGFIVKKRLFKQMSALKIQNCFDFFEQMRSHLYENSQRVIRYHWLKYKKNKKKLFTNKKGKKGTRKNPQTGHSSSSINNNANSNGQMRGTRIAQMAKYGNNDNQNST